MGDTAAFMRRHFLVWLSLAALLVPLPARQAPQYLDWHRVAFCIGPALYQFGVDLLPGPDLFSQYGAGQGFFASFLLGESAQETIGNLFLLYVAVTLGFFIIGYHFLERLFDSRGWAFAVCVVAILGQFYESEGVLSFSVTPSVGAYRAPFIILVGWLLASRLSGSSSPGSTILLGLVLGLSLFWQTDTGLASLVACLGTIVLLSRSILRCLSSIGALSVTALVTFFALSTVAYGTGALSTRYVQGLFAPWLWYTGGELTLNGFAWHFDNGYLMTQCAFVCAISVLVYTVMHLDPPSHHDPFQASALVFLACISLLLHAKYALRPFYGYWAGAALPALAVVAWFARETLPHLYLLLLGKVTRAIPRSQATRTAGILTMVTALCCAAWLAFGIRSDEDYLGKARYGFPSYRNYRSVFNVAVRTALGSGEKARPIDPGPKDAAPGGVRPSPERAGSGASCTQADIALIRRNTGDTERTAIISPIDWVFLLEAKRPPRFYVLPMPFALPSSYPEIARIARESRVLFVEKQCDFLTSVDPNWREHFYQADESDNLVMFRPRKNPS